MPIANIVDRRENHGQSEYIVECDVVFEPSYHDNYLSTKESSQFPELPDAFGVEWINNTTIAEAIKYAECWDFPVTMFIYKKGSTPCL